VSSFLLSSWGSSSFFLFFIFVFVFWFDQGPLFFFLNGEFKGSVMVTSAIVADTGVPPELINCERHKDNVGVVELMVVANPATNEAPCGFNGWVSSETGNFLWFATYSKCD